MRISAWIWLFAILSCFPLTADETVPEWFRYDPTRPYAIFDAWRHLATREAALYLGKEWEVLGGILIDQHGKPLPRTPLTIRFHNNIRSFAANLVTDDNGYFLIYSPYSLRVSPTVSADVRGDDATVSSVPQLPLPCGFSACPGYPFSEAGLAFARENRAGSTCGAKPLLERKDRAFYILVCWPKGDFDPDAFARFKEETRRKDAEHERPPWRDRPQPREGPTDGREVTRYRLQLTNPNGNGIPNAIVKYMAYDGYEGNSQVVETNAEGECVLEEYLLKEKPREYFDEVRRRLTVDAPGYGVGPVPCGLRPNVSNRIEMQEPAAVAGVLLDHHKNPLHVPLSLRYRREHQCAFETRIPLKSDGAFAFDRIMPGEVFRVEAGRRGWQTTPTAPVASEWMQLGASQAKTDVRLTVPLASAIRGIVVDQQGEPVTKTWDLTYLRADGDNWGHGAPHNHRFGTFAIGQQPFRIRVCATGFTEFISGQIRLEPGELRFVKLVLKRND